jgi:hypothetical protein
MSLANALGALARFGVVPKEVKVLHEGESEVVLLHLASCDMRDTVLKLIEAGFTRVKGLNPVAIVG